MGWFRVLKWAPDIKQATEACNNDDYIPTVHSHPFLVNRNDLYRQETL